MCSVVVGLGSEYIWGAGAMLMNDDGKGREGVFQLL